VRDKRRGYASCLLVCALSFVAGCRERERATSAPQPFSLVREIDGAHLVFDEARFRSVRKDGRLVDTVTMEGRSELSLTPPVPSEVSYRLHLPEDPVLRFATGVSSLGEETLPAVVELEMSVESDGRETQVFSDTVRRMAGNRWRDHDVDLRPWAGKDVTLTLASRFRSPHRVSVPALAAWGDPVVADAGTTERRPTIVLISIDCLRADHVGAYGYPHPTTPTIDALARGGTLFEKAFSTAPWTLPSHMSMLTGLLPSLHGATKWEKLSKDVDYLPELLDGAGYRTAGVVSWVYLSQVYGFERGFDFYQVLDAPKETDVVDVALKELDRGVGRPQFLFVHLFSPHWPYLPPPDLLARLGGRPRDISTLLDKTSTVAAPADETERDEVIRLYDAEVASADRELGRLLERLKKNGLYDNALVIVTADHGEAFLEHGHWQHSQTLYDELTHVPLVVKFPGERAAARWPKLVSSVDIFVTAAEAAGLRVSTSKSGVMARASLASPLDVPRTVLSEVTTRSPQGTFMKVAIRNATHKYMATLSGPVGDDLGVSKVDDEAFYDLTSDPHERRNLLASEDARGAAPFRSELRQFLDAARAARSLRKGDAVELDAATMEKLRALGYVP
jgi:arylsulfatase A-like enzyme